jgi:hypothetical protein
MMEIPCDLPQGVLKSVAMKSSPAVTLEPGDHVA